MKLTSNPLAAIIILSLLAGSQSCGDIDAPDPKAKDIVEIPEQIDSRKSKNIREVLKFALQNSGRMNDSLRFRVDTLVDFVYKQQEYQPLWSKDENLSAQADSLIRFIENCKEYGLFPSDYHNRVLHNHTELLKSDSASMKDAAIWSRTDLLLTDAFVLLSKHLKQGRLKFDSVTLRKDSLIVDSFYLGVLRSALASNNIREVFQSLEPKKQGYDSLKVGLKYFLDSIKVFKRYTRVIYPNKDTVALYKQLQKRFFEADLLPSASDFVDSATWRATFSQYQKSRGIKVTGRVNENTVNNLNNTDWEKFKRIAVTLDRYKLLPDTMPEKYIWVNIPAYMMKLIANDTVVFASRVVVGKPETRTPVLTSKITDMITYPQWTIPTSIIVKEILPGIKKNPAYLSKRGYSLINYEGEEVDPYTVDWSKYTKGIPYKVVQGSGDANALGILKFNFSNKYSVYLHDTNQRYLFKNASRSLSHGCVRVQEWQKLAYYLIKNDSLKSKSSASFVGTDSLNAWLSRKEKRYMPVKSAMPVFIRYFSCEGQGGKVKFYEDIYREDKMLAEKYFADKSIQ